MLVSSASEKVVSSLEGEASKEQFDGEILAGVHRYVSNLAGHQTLA
jgi:hypothetical protein